MSEADQLFDEYFPSAASPKKASMFDKYLGYTSRLGDVYQKVRLADKGVATNPTRIYETNGASDPLVTSGQPAGVVGNDPLADVLNNATDKVALAYVAKQANDSMPYIVGMVALGITIFLLTKK